MVKGHFSWCVIMFLYAHSMDYLQIMMVRTRYKNEIVSRNTLGLLCFKFKFFELINSSHGEFEF